MALANDHWQWRCSHVARCCATELSIECMLHRDGKRHQVAASQPFVPSSGVGVNARRGDHIATLAEDVKRQFFAERPNHTTNRRSIERGSKVEMPSLAIAARRFIGLRDPKLLDEASPRRAIKVNDDGSTSRTTSDANVCVGIQ